MDGIRQCSECFHGSNLRKTSKDELQFLEFLIRFLGPLDGAFAETTTKGCKFIAKVFQPRRACLQGTDKLRADLTARSNNRSIQALLLRAGIFDKVSIFTDLFINWKFGELRCLDIVYAQKVIEVPRSCCRLLHLPRKLLDKSI